MNRRKFVRNTLAAAFAAGVSKLSIGDSHSHFFHLKKEAGRWWLTRPDGEKYFSLGLNHIDPATLRYAENLHIWREKYGNSMERWLKDSVAPNLKEWGFNCLGWNQEVISRGFTNRRHSRHFTYEEYQWLGMPYCHQLPFADFHQWEAKVKIRIFIRTGFPPGVIMSGENTASHWPTIRN